MAFRYASSLARFSRTAVIDRSLALNRPQTSLGFFRTMCSKKEAEMVKEQSETAAEPTSATQNMGKGFTEHKTNYLDRVWLAWGGKYKSIKDVPIYVSQDTMEFYRNKARIKIMFAMMAITLLGCLAMVRSGKLAEARGDTVAKMNEEFHREYRLQRQKEIEAAGATKGS